MTLRLRPFALGLALVGSCTGALATPLITNQLTPDVEDAPTFFGGTLRGSAVTPISNISYSGTARSAVYDTGSGLDFYYQFTNDVTSQNGIERFTGFDFSSLGAAGIVNVFQIAEAFGIFSVGTERSNYADRTAMGVIGFNFVPDGFSKIVPGTTSYTQVIRTSARTFTEGNFGLLNGIGDNARAFAPTDVAGPQDIPEPGGLGLALAGLGGVGSAWRRRGQVQAGPRA